jgi:succinylarginine dihydrolase
MTDTAATTYELNLDGLVGPTHSYAGLSRGNLASQRHRGEVSNPRKAVLQGLAKMKLLHELGVPQAVLPPHERPDLFALRRLGFGGTDAAVLAAAAREAPELLAACCSASSMWAANAATVSPSADTTDGRVHFTPANLVTQFHRSLEPATTAAVLRAIFPPTDDNGDSGRFVHHPPLPSAAAFADEGAANHMRLCPDYGRRGLEVFVYGRSALHTSGAVGPTTYPARQTREACAAVARLHELRGEHTVLLRQNPDAIDAGAFHNDVVAVANLNVLLHHAAAFADGPAGVDRVREAYARTCDSRDQMTVITVSEHEVPLADAVSSYLFNSQLVRLPGGATALIAPSECQENDRVRAYLDGLIGPGRAIACVRFVNLRQSMRNGGGPACLRLRVALSGAELARVHSGVQFDDDLYARLVGWAKRHYRDHLCPDDLADPRFLDECYGALYALTEVLGLGPIYRFQGRDSDWDDHRNVASRSPDPREPHAAPRQDRRGERCHRPGRRPPQTK